MFFVCVFSFGGGYVGATVRGGRVCGGDGGGRGS